MSRHVDDNNDNANDHTNIHHTSEINSNINSDNTIVTVVLIYTYGFTAGKPG